MKSKMIQSLKPFVAMLIFMTMLIGIMPSVILAEERVEFLGGTGSPEDPYQIANAQQLQLMAERVNANVGNYGKAHYSLIRDIVMPEVKEGESNHTAIGLSNIGYQFTGSFDGNGKAIRGIIINKPKSSHQGLFGYIGEEGIVKNVTLLNSDIKGQSFAGGIAGINYGTIDNCIYTGTISGSRTGGGYTYTGGIAGYNRGTVGDSYNNGAISSKGGTSGFTYTGGIVGGNRGTVKNSGNRGAVTIGDISGLTYTGGVVGRNMNNATVENSYNTGDIAGKSNVGNIVGYDDGVVKNCFNMYSQDIKTTYNHITEKLNIEVEKYNPNTNIELSYQWYAYDFEVDKGMEIIGATNKEYGIPKDLNAGDSYYYADIKIQWQNEAGANKSFTAKSNTVEVVVDKATPILPIFPTFEAIYGQTLGEIKLPEGFSWEHEENTLVGGLGNNRFRITYTPEDLQNYHMIEEIEVSIQVQKGIPDYKLPTDLTATYGQALGDIKLPEGFRWQSQTSTSVGDVGENIFLVTYTPKDIENYKKVSDIPVAIRVSKVPTEFTYVNNEEIKESDGKESNEMKDVEVITSDHFERNNLLNEDTRESKGKGFNEMEDVKVSVRDEGQGSDFFNEGLEKPDNQGFDKIADVQISGAKDAEVRISTNLLLTEHEEKEWKETSRIIYYIIGVFIVVAGILLYANRTRKGRES